MMTTSSKKLLARTAGVTAAIGLTVLAPTTYATAAPGSNATTYKGEVTAKTSLAQRTGPSTSAPAAGRSYRKGKVLRLDCNLNGTSVGGNDFWYKLAGRHSWVSARYIKNIGAAPIVACTAGSTPATRTAKTTAILNFRQGPSTHDRSVGQAAKHAGVDVWCKVTSQEIRGNRTWYLAISSQADGWASAKYIKTHKKIPYC